MKLPLISFYLFVFMLAAAFGLLMAAIGVVLR